MTNCLKCLINLQYKFKKKGRDASLNYCYVTHHPPDKDKKIGSLNGTIYVKCNGIDAVASIY